MRIYLDCCCLQRPWDDQRQPRIRVETEALIVVLSQVEAGNLRLLGSEALDYEISRIPDTFRREEVQQILVLAAEYRRLDADTEALVHRLRHSGIGPMDAVHLALASQASADVFATTDDKLLVKAQAMTGLGCRSLSLLALVDEVA